MYRIERQQCFQNLQEREMQEGLDVDGIILVSVKVRKWMDSSAKNRDYLRVLMKHALDIELVP